MPLVDEYTSEGRNALGLLLKTCRQHKRWTVAQLAEKADLSTGAVIRLEAKADYCQMQTLKRVTDALGYQLNITLEPTRAVSSAEEQATHNRLVTGSNPVRPTEKENMTYTSNGSAVIGNRVVPPLEVKVLHAVARLASSNATEITEAVNKRFPFVNASLASVHSMLRRLEERQLVTRSVNSRLCMVPTVSYTPELAAVNFFSQHPMPGDEDEVFQT